MKKAIQKRKKQLAEELNAFENMHVSDFDEDSLNVSSSKEGEI